jgi:hypothetical protein
LTPVKITIKKGDRVAPLPGSVPPELVGRVGVVEKAGEDEVLVAFRGLPQRMRQYRKTSFRPGELMVQKEFL